jgi:hypothetical protein
LNLTLATVSKASLEHTEIQTKYVELELHNKELIEQAQILDAEIQIWRSGGEPENVQQKIVEEQEKFKKLSFNTANEKILAITKEVRELKIQRENDLAAFENKIASLGAQLMQEKTEKATLESNYEGIEFFCVIY